MTTGHLSFEDTFVIMYTIDVTPTISNCQDNTIPHTWNTSVVIVIYVHDYIVLFSVVLTIPSLYSKRQKSRICSGVLK